MCEDVGQQNCATRLEDSNDIFAYDELFCCCREKIGSPTFASYAFFIFFTILGALVLMTLFIGVITTSMEEAQQGQKQEKDDEEAVEKAILSMGLGPEIVAHYKVVFNLLDVDGSGGIDEDELKQGLDKMSTLYFYGRNFILAKEGHFPSFSDIFSLVMIFLASAPVRFVP